MKMICEVPDEVIKCIKDGTWCGSSVAEKMIANGIPLSSSEEPCKDAISRQAVLNVVEKAVTKEVARWSIKELPPVNPQEPICPSAGVDCEDCPAYEPKVLNKWIGAEVLDRIRNEMHATAEKHEDGVYYMRDEWVDEIIDKYAEGSGEE